MCSIAVTVNDIKTTNNKTHTVTVQNKVNEMKMVSIDETKCWTKCNNNDVDIELKQQEQTNFRELTREREQWQSDTMQQYI